MSLLEGLSTMGRRLWYFVFRDRATRDLEEEIRLHIELRAQQVGSAAARKRFGNTTTILERSREMWGLMNAEEITRDFRFALRRLAKRPGFTIGVVTVTAIGIGAVTAMFSAVDAAMLRPLPFKSPEQLVSLRQIDVPFDAGTGQTRNPAQKPNITDMRVMTADFTSVAAYASGGVNLADPEFPIRVKAGVVTNNFFSTLGLRPLIGRTFSNEEGVPDGPNVVVLSYGLWQQQFGGRDIAGMHVMLGAKSFSVIGVMPERFSFPSESDLWIPLTVPATFATFDAFRGFLATSAIARLAPGVTRATAAAHVLTRIEQWGTLLKATDRARYLDFLQELQTKGIVVPLQTQLVGDRRPALFVLLGATGLLLLIACVNVTNLLLSQAVLRQRELAVRQVLGATRGRLVRQLLAESLALSIGGALLGLIFAPLALQFMRALLPNSLSGVAPAQIDLRVLMFATALALATGIAFGLWPAFRSTGTDENATIKGGGGHGSTAAKAGSARRLLVSVELALTVMLLVGAGLMLRSFDHLMRQDNGMQASRVATLEMTMTSRGRDRGERVRKINDIVSRLSAMGGITNVGVVNDLPLGGGGGISVSVDVDGAPPLKDGDMRFARYLYATGGYFQTMGIRLLRGRLFTAADDSLAPPVLIISNSMAREYWPGVDPIGRTISMGSSHVTVVGVVSDVREDKIDDKSGPQMYYSMQTSPPLTLAIVARGTVPDKTMLSQLLAAVRSVDKSQAVYSVRMMGDVMNAATAPRRTNTVLIGAFATLALLLASVGVYAVVSNGVTHRTRELGIRSALGATGANLLQLISREMMWVTVIGIVIGMVGAWALARTLEALVYGVDIHDAVTFAVVPLALLLPTALATLIPARRVMRVNPADVMRAD